MARSGPDLPLHAVVGQAQRAFDLMCERANAADGVREPLARKQFIQGMVFDTAAEIQACRLLTLDAAHKIDRGDPARVEIGIIKVVGAAMVHAAIDRAIQVHGAKGVTADTPLERMYRQARFARIYDGPRRGAPRHRRAAAAADLRTRRQRRLRRLIDGGLRVRGEDRRRDVARDLHEPGGAGVHAVRPGHLLPRNASDGGLGVDERVVI